MTALRRQIDVGQRSLPPPGSSAGSTEFVGAGVVQSYSVDVVLCGRIKAVRISEAQNRTGWLVIGLANHLGKKPDELKRFIVLFNEICLT